MATQSMTPVSSESNFHSFFSSHFWKIFSQGGLKRKEKERERDFKWGYYGMKEFNNFHKNAHSYIFKKLLRNDFLITERNKNRWLRVSSFYNLAGFLDTPKADCQRCKNELRAPSSFYYKGPWLRLFTFRHVNWPWVKLNTTNIPKPKIGIKP